MGTGCPRSGDAGTGTARATATEPRAAAWPGCDVGAREEAVRGDGQM